MEKSKKIRVRSKALTQDWKWPVEYRDSPYLTKYAPLGHMPERLVVLADDGVGQEQILVEPDGSLVQFCPLLTYGGDPTLCKALGVKPGGTLIIRVRPVGDQCTQDQLDALRALKRWHQCRGLLRCPRSIILTERSRAVIKSIHDAGSPLPVKGSVSVPPRSLEETPPRAEASCPHTTPATPETPSQTEGRPTRSGKPRKAASQRKVRAASRQGSDQR